MNESDIRKKIHDKIIELKQDEVKAGYSMNQNEIDILYWVLELLKND